MKLPSRKELDNILLQMEPEDEFHKRTRMEMDNFYNKLLEKKDKRLLCLSHDYLYDRKWKRAIDSLMNLFRSKDVVSLGSWTPLKREFANRWTTYRYRPWNDFGIKARQILLSEVGNPLNKRIAVESDAEIVGFDHGSIHSIYEYHCYNHYPQCDRMICSSFLLAENRRNEYQRTPISQMWPVRFEVVPIVVKPKPRKPEVPNSVLVIGHPMNGKRYLSYAGNNTYTQYELSLRVIEDFKRIGKKVIYKMHPDRIVYGEHTDMCDLVLTERFEKCWHLAESYFFGCTATSTLNWAMQTDRPIYIPLIKGTELSREFQMFSDRFSWMPSEIVNNRIVYDLKEEKRRFEPCTF